MLQSMELQRVGHNLATEQSHINSVKLKEERKELFQHRSYFFFYNLNLGKVNVNGKNEANKNENLNYISIYSKIIRQIVLHSSDQFLLQQQIYTGDMKITYGNEMFYMMRGFFEK